MYFDTAYLAKCYLNEVDARAVRKLASSATGLYSSSWCIPEFACVLHRHIRESRLSQDQARHIRDIFREDVRNGVWSLLPLTEHFLSRVDATVTELPASVHMRAGDAIHLAAAKDAGFDEIWSNDRLLLKAAPSFGLLGKSV
jgi:predicted nucleic acid-binding protein